MLSEFLIYRGTCKDLAIPGFYKDNKKHVVKSKIYMGVTG